MHKNSLILILLFILKTVWSQPEKHFKGQMFSADVNMGYNLARIETNYRFEEQNALFLSVNWQV